MERRPLNLLTAVSLLLWVAVTGLWVHSYLRDSHVKWVLLRRDDPQGAEWLGVYFAPGVLGLTRWTYAGPGTGGGEEAAIYYASWAEWNRYQEKTSAPPPPATNFWERAGFHLWHATQTDTSDPYTMWGWLLRRPRNPVLIYRVDQLFLTLPYWSLVSATASIPILRILFACGRKWRRRTKVAKNLCPSCGYDLRATPGRCPECGESRSAKLDEKASCEPSAQPSSDAGPRWS